MITRSHVRNEYLITVVPYSRKICCRLSGSTYLIEIC